MIEKIQALARHAGQMMLSYRDAAIHQKEGHYNFVTDADVAVQQFLKAELLSLLPGSRFFAEEQENDPLTDQPTFIVDPIDGTLNYMRHRNASAVSIALAEKKQPVMGVIYNPYADEMFSAEKGKGAYLNGGRIAVSDTAFGSAMVSIGTSPYDPDLARRTLKAALRFLLEAGDLRRTGSAALDLCDVACGRADIFYELCLRPWDVAAGALLVAQAGGVFVSLGHDAPYFESASGILACNPACLAKAKRILEEETA
ncbi:MAG: inositol monophosphatase [Clostridia bacterium]|nr:inositol monophosphatase [Clostridia bacterium]